MCGRYSAAADLDELAERFQADATPAEAAGHQPNWNVAPTSQVLVVTAAAEGSDGEAGEGGDADGQGARQLRKLRWGLVPAWAKDTKTGNRMINVRSESVTDKTTFKRLLVRSRCILPADGFYEWQTLDDGEGAQAGSGKRRQRKQPFYITARDGAPLALAGLWTTNKHADPSGPVETCTILTTEANRFMSTIHHRMPVILPPEVWDTWLDPEVKDLDRLAGLLKPAPDELLQMWPVDTAVNSARSSGPELTRVLEGHEPRVWEPAAS
jgi:putative SOS response-associated peptidase YedK